MMDMLMECAIFHPVDEKSANYYQLSGPPISDLEPYQAVKEDPTDSLRENPPVTKPTNPPIQNRTPCKIAFVRSRMFYAKAALNARGGIRFGMRHIRP